MLIVGYGGNPVHAPENTRTACLSAYVTGADAVCLPVRLTKDNYAVVARDETIDRLTGEAGRVADLTLRELRAKDFGAKFCEADGGAFRYPARVETLGQLVDAIPPELRLIVELMPEADAARRGELLKQVIGVLRNRGLLGQATLCSSDPQLLKEIRQTAGVSVGSTQAGPDAGAQITAAVQAKADLAVLDLDSVVAADGAVTPAAAELARRTAGGELKGALFVSRAGFTAKQFEALRGKPFAWGMATNSVLAAAEAFRPGWKWIDEKWAQRAADHADVNADLWHLGYAKHNEPPCIHIYPDNGIHVEIGPYQGEVGYRPTGDPVADALHELKERSWYALKDWPFYSGGGVGFVPGILGDFSAEVDMASARAQQATTVEMAAVNVDPAAHHKPWVQNGQQRWMPNYTTSSRDRHTFFDPHGCPPYVGVEHDEDDGWRINWNLGTDYESNQYGKAFGDGKLLTGRVRLDRRGPYFAAYYRATGKNRPLDWVCVGAVRNDSLNPKVFLRVVGKRWRQENPARPAEWMPVIPNHFTFGNMTITRYV